MVKLRVDNVCLVDGVRTPIGIPHKSLKKHTIAQLSAELIQALARRHHLKKNMVDEVVLGTTVSAGSGQNFARQAALLAELPYRVPAYQVNNVCGSGLHTVIAAARSILVSDAQSVIAGGAESISQIPNFVVRDDDIALRDKTEVDGLVLDGLWCQYSDQHMGDLCEALAREHGITREEQDAYALQSHVKANLANEAQRFAKEIIPLPVTANRVLAHDEHVRKRIRIESYQGLSPVFQKKGTITAGTASAPCDGAAAILVASRRYCRKHRLQPLAKVAGYAALGVEPKDTFRAAVPAIRQCLKQCRWRLADVDLFEVCEAFAAQALYTQRELQIPDDRMNIHGGDLALGHPLGASGARVLVTLLHALHSQKCKKGLAVVCLGGGGAVAIAITRI